MSDLQKSFAKAKLAKFPPEPPLIMDPLDEAAHEGDDDASSSASSTGTAVPSPTRNLFARPSRGTQSNAPFPWTDFFTQELYLTQEPPDTNARITHHVYITPPTDSSVLFVMHHGAGSSGLSFAVCAEEIRRILPKAGVLAVDAREHGGTTTTTTGARADGDGNGNVEYDLHLETLSRDLLFVLHETQARLAWRDLPDIVLVGHSLGGAVVTDVAKKGELGQKMLAYAVLDVVEGSAMDALQSMEQYLSTRPTRFPSLSSGIEWHTRSRTIRNRTSARASVPSLLYEAPSPPTQTTQSNAQALPADSSPSSSASAASGSWHWRTNLTATKPFWENWFTGLSSKFLQARGGKLLILAGTDRLDRELMIGQMQGKFQLQILPEAGHFIQEDQPEKTAQILVDFFKRNDRGALVLPPKVADLQALGAMKKGGGSGVQK